MGIERIRPNGKCWRNVFLLVGGTYLFFLLLAFCFPVAGDDWFFTTRYQNENLFFAIRRGIDTAKQHFITTNGRYLGNAFSGMFGCSAVLRALFRGGVMLGVWLAVCRLCKVQKISGYFLAAALVVALPPMMFGQAYAWAAGFFNYVPPLFLLLLYLCGAAPLFSEENKSDRWYHGVSFFLLGGVHPVFRGKRDGGHVPAVRDFVGRFSHHEKAMLLEAQRAFPWHSSRSGFDVSGPWLSKCG